MSISKPIAGGIKGCVSDGVLLVVVLVQIVETEFERVSRVRREWGSVVG